MPNATEMLTDMEMKLVADEAPEDLFHGQFSKTWLAAGNKQREAVLQVLRRLSDITAHNTSMWATYEVSVTLTNGQKALWFSYTGQSWNIWTNWGLPEELCYTSQNLVFDDSEPDARQTVVQTIRDFFTPAVLDAAA